MVSRPINLRRHIYNHGDYVDAFHEGFWQLGIVKGMEYVNGIGYNVWLTNKNEIHAFSDKMLKPSETFSQEIAKEFEEEMPDPTQEKCQQNEQEQPIQVIEDPWLGDSQNFVNPKPMEPPKSKRFLEVSEKEIDMLQDQSKSSKTHKLTAWGVKALRGKNIILTLFLHVKFILILPLFQLFVRPPPPSHSRNTQK